MNTYRLYVKLALLFAFVGGVGHAQIISSLELRENPYSVLSALVSFEVLDAPAGAEVRVHYEY